VDLGLNEDMMTIRNPFLQGLASLVANTSIGVKMVSAIILLSYCLSYSETALLSLSLTPGYFWPPHFWLWTAFTYSFLEIHCWIVFIDIVTIFLVGKLLEPLWGNIEMVTFFIIVNTGVAVFSSVFYYFLYMVTFNTDHLFQTHIHGLAGYLGGVAVAVKQAMPDYVIYRTPMGKITNSNVPLGCFIFTFIMWMIGLVECECIMFASGIIISWIYLRFYQLHANGSRGDSSDSFSFASFFPNVLQPPINACFGILVRLKICKKRIRRYDIGASNSGGPTISISLPGVDNHDTERRRQIALKALKDRLSKADQSTEASKWPSLDDESASPTVPTHQRGMVDTKKVTEENLVETAQEEDDQIEQSIDDVAINVEADDKEPLLK